MFFDKFIAFSGAGESYLIATVCRYEYGVTLSMQTLYVKEQGAKVGCTGRRLTVTKEEQELLTVPICRLTRVVLIGRVQITTQAAALLLDRRIPLVMATLTGRLRGVLVPPDTPHVTLRLNQYELAKNPQYGFNFCRDLVAARAASACNVIRRYLYNHPKKDLRPHIQKILDYASQVSNQPSIDSLRGMEGMIAREYFAALVKIFQDLGMNFSGRIRRPPTDPVNACLSYTYILLTEHCSCALQTTRLDIYLGFMHQPNRNAPALALDFVEQFRQPVADRFVMLLFNKKMLQPSDFSPGPMNAVLLSEQAKRTLMTQWEIFLDTPQRLLENQPALSPRDLLYRQAEAMEAAVRQKQPFCHYRLCL
ncbi:MAG TPA: CRISPR-associated endonuclease Cas1 [Anaerohalosphaeraceae bacterium]|nr:CRISPR-associated endonuclease Cas1 [Anaerohalosphaeraceae bacterium]HOL32717.1 CRISPR-associated endonuclease Cas1 [Anaerohalosphaeraceae bacterium]HOM77188.1 CRISPR-associated endonuclease Cas1 [Anaerohalosphaeraceae bacterium]HPO71100.1 CRISPR-associated endonuclease Cas1 [Anaerohalosphaeraceae bacterium]HRS72680.1 CRISPR-associated endonuclease Cas1 [Anaerohalosphaeraceae bacterium]